MYSRTVLKSRLIWDQPQNTYCNNLDVTTSWSGNLAYAQPWGVILQGIDLRDLLVLVFTRMHLVGLIMLCCFFAVVSSSSSSCCCWCCCFFFHVICNVANKKVPHIFSGWVMIRNSTIKWCHCCWLMPHRTFNTCNACFFCVQRYIDHKTYGLV